jgi:hypothetical protein
MPLSNTPGLAFTQVAPIPQYDPHITAKILTERAKIAQEAAELDFREKQLDATEDWRGRQIIEDRRDAAMEAIRIRQAEERLDLSKRRQEVSENKAFFGFVDKSTRASRQASMAKFRMAMELLGDTNFSQEIADRVGRQVTGYLGTLDQFRQGMPVDQEEVKKNRLQILAEIPEGTPGKERIAALLEEAEADMIHSNIGMAVQREFFTTPGTPFEESPLIDIWRRLSNQPPNERVPPPKTTQTPVEREAKKADLLQRTKEAERQRR